MSDSAFLSLPSSLDSRRTVIVNVDEIAAVRAYRAGNSSHEFSQIILKSGHELNCGVPVSEVQAGIRKATACE